jgi:energy-coupling factor transport system ATP-binding protein
LAENLIATSSKDTVPLTVVAGKRFIDCHGIKFQQRKRIIPSPSGDPALKIEHVDFKYG